MELAPANSAWEKDGRGGSSFEARVPSGEPRETEGSPNAKKQKLTESRRDEDGEGDHDKDDKDDGETLGGGENRNRLPAQLQCSISSARKQREKFADLAVSLVMGHVSDPRWLLHDTFALPPDPAHEHDGDHHHHHHQHALAHASPKDLELLHSISKSMHDSLLQLMPTMLVPGTPASMVVPTILSMTPLRNPDSRESCSSYMGPDGDMDWFGYFNNARVNSPTSYDPEGMLTLPCKIPLSSSVNLKDVSRYPAK
jgi:hypothetical protein